MASRDSNFGRPIYRHLVGDVIEIESPVCYFPTSVSIGPSRNHLSFTQPYSHQPLSCLSGAYNGFLSLLVVHDAHLSILNLIAID